MRDVGRIKANCGWVDCRLSLWSLQQLFTAVSQPATRILLLTLAVELHSPPLLLSSSLMVLFIVFVTFLYYSIILLNILVLFGKARNIGLKE